MAFARMVLPELGIVRAIRVVASLEKHGEWVYIVHLKTKRRERKRTHPCGEMARACAGCITSSRRPTSRLRSLSHLPSSAPTPPNPVLPSIQSENSAPTTLDFYDMVLITASLVCQHLSAPSQLRDAKEASNSISSRRRGHVSCQFASVQIRTMGSNIAIDSQHG